MITTTLGVGLVRPQLALKDKIDMTVVCGAGSHVD